MNYRAWQLKNADTAGESALLAAGYGPLLARVLACRGIAQPQAAAALLEEEPPLRDPFLLKDMDKAVARIQQAIENGETIVIFGDYDVDGVSATAILYECLTNLGAQVRCKLPTREGGGYGLNRETLQKLADKGYKLIVTVDNGISAIEEADLAAELGIELVITDHHPSRICAVPVWRSSCALRWKAVRTPLNCWNPLANLPPLAPLRT